MVAGGLFLLVAVLVFFIHHNEAEGFDGGKYRRARADDNSGAALANLVPFIVAFAGG